MNFSRDEAPRRALKRLGWRYNGVERMEKVGTCKIIRGLSVFRNVLLTDDLLQSESLNFKEGL